MENRVIDDVRIREYLLGRLDDDPELVEQIDEQILTDPEFSMSVDVVEDEIIEEYIEDSLSSNDLYVVEKHFLRPPERQHKLRNARLFSRHFATSAVNKTNAHGLKSALRPSQASRPLWMIPSLRTCVEIAASVLFAVTILYLWNQRRTLDIALNGGKQQLSQERQRSSSLNEQLQAALQLAQPSTVMLNLVEAGLSRGASNLPAAIVRPATKTLHLEVALASEPSGKYRVRLQHAGTIIWSFEDVTATAAPGGAILRIDIPTAVLSEGACDLVLSQPGEHELSYWFHITKLR